MALVPPELFQTLFPNGIVHYALGGVLIGLGVAFIYALTGLTPGASSVLESTWSYVSKRPALSEGPLRASRGWRLVFTAGIVSGAVLYTGLTGGGVWTTDVQLWRLAIGGFLVGLGTRLGKGCTSGHGICGVGSLSETSLLNVLVFLLVAIGTAGIVVSLGVSP
ncbi:YeeE/YedE family protein [Halodesulfurarchaeum sp.]|uniref:YeeE/YedE family protein n=1 Tax=Halodesulfurarchaeum sp. TaxID=1980530 RepID=UPI001BB99AC8|nr:YeeE/YedE family protein [Halodesulfurarchaeum sp.]